MQTWKLVLEYDGTKYRGWQEQFNARTVMGDLRQAAEAVFRSEVELQGAGRTDAGVHAAGQVAHLRVRKRITQPAAFLEAQLNDKLPSDIAILEMEETGNDFHARHDAVARRYVYQIANRKSAFSKKYVWWIKEPLNVARMAEAAALLKGRHDFQCFRAPDPTKPGESTVVVVDEALVEEDGPLILFRIEASHFLWRMVRRLAGVLVRLGKDEITMEDFERLMAGRPDPRLDVAAWTAPAAGLFLDQVRYRPAGAPRRKKK